MRNPIALFAALFMVAATSLYGCKEEEETFPLNEIPKIKTYTYTVNGAEITEIYAYDEMGRVSSITYLAGETKVSYYTYHTDSITEVRNNRMIRVYHLNSDGYADTTSLKSAVYDRDGYLTSSGSAVYAWSEGNLVSITGGAETVVATYLADKTNTIGNLNRGIDFFGKDSKNLVDTLFTNGNPQVYFYEFDSLGRVSKVNDKETYTYY